MVPKLGCVATKIKAVMPIYLVIFFPSMDEVVMTSIGVDLGFLSENYS